MQVLVALGVRLRRKPQGNPDFVCSFLQTGRTDNLTQLSNDFRLQNNASSQPKRKAPYVQPLFKI